MKQYKLQIHDEVFSLQEVIINPTKFTNIKVGDILAMSQSNSSQTFYIKVSSVETIKGISEISLSKDIISKNQFDPNIPVSVEITNDDISLSHLELRVKDQYVSGGDMWKFKKIIINQTVYLGKYLEELGIKASAILMLRNGQECKSGLILEKTKITFRSPSGHMYWLIQMSREMWEYTPSGDLHYEKGIEFFGELYDKWNQEKVNHSVRIILFARYYINQNDESSETDGFFALNGKKYLDFYKKLNVNLNTISREKLLIILKKEFIEYPKQIKKHSLGNEMTNSVASEGNILESMNLVFKQYEERHLNRDMQRTGYFIHIITAGQGVITVNNPNIAYITQHMLVKESITVDMICLSHPPTHGVPILRCKNINKVYFVNSTQIFRMTITSTLIGWI
jgi:DEP domain-containing protein 5